MRFTTLLFTVGWLTLTIQPAAVAATHQTGRAEPQDQPRSTAGIISATILDESGEPMMGVTVQISGSKTVYITDSKGYFEFMTTKPSETIRLSFIGYKAKSITLQAGKSQRITLDPDSETLTDVVITGFTKKDKKSFTGSQTTVKAKELLSMGTKNLLESLEAFVPGLQIVQQNNLGSDPNARPDLNLRGRATFSGAANLPLFVVDGAIVDVNYIYDMDMNTIESVTVLKDASASALYGAKAAAGVIVITTKPIEQGAIRLNYSGTLRLTTPDLSGYHLLNPEQKLRYEELAGVYTGSDPAEQYRKDLERMVGTVNMSGSDPYTRATINPNASTTEKLVETRVFRPHNRYLPIPQFVLDRNPKFGANNPGYN